LTSAALHLDDDVLVVVTRRDDDFDGGHYLCLACSTAAHEHIQRTTITVTSTAATQTTAAEKVAACFSTQARTVLLHDSAHGVLGQLKQRVVQVRRHVWERKLLFAVDGDL
jgi:hypothetical protein